MTLEAAGANPTLAWKESHTYDDAGNRHHSERRDGAGRLTWQQDRAFDVQHRVVRETNPEATTRFRSWVFDASGFLVSAADEEARTTVYLPDGINRVQKVTRKGPEPTGVLVENSDLAISSALVLIMANSVGSGWLLDDV